MQAETSTDERGHASLPPTQVQIGSDAKSNPVASFAGFHVVAPIVGKSIWYRGLAALARPTARCARRAETHVAQNFFSRDDARVVPNPLVRAD
jgi:hypothetical protein